MTQNKKGLLPVDFIKSDINNFDNHSTTSTINIKNPLLFISKISHELRAILHVIVNLSNPLHLHNKTNEHQKRYINAISKSAEDLNNLISILLISNSSDNSEINIYRKATNLSIFIDDIVNQHRLSLTQEHSTSIELHCDTQEIFASIDAFWIKQVMLNLLDNAVKYGNSGNIIIKLEATLWNNRDSIAISIIDEGIGIPENDIKNIFNLYKRINHDNNISKSGDGIGLHICQEVVAAHSGLIDIQNNLQKGLTVRIILPK